MNRKRIHSKRKTVSNQSKIYSKYLKTLKKIFEEKRRNENRRRDSHEKR